MKKYELTSETKVIDGVEVHRIKALKSFGNIKEGDFGGWIESEINLSQCGNAWVYGYAVVRDNAEVYGNAVVCGYSTVDGYATVCGNATVGGNAKVCGNAKVYDNATVFGNARVGDNARVGGNARVCGNARVGGDAMVCGNATVGENTRVCDNATVCENAMVDGIAMVDRIAMVDGDAWVSGNAVVGEKADYIVFKNWWSSGRHFTWTRSNNKWTVGCFYGSGEELIKKAYKDSAKSGREYERVVKYVNDILKEEDNGNRNKREG